jgi:hypothetical protein
VLEAMPKIDVDFEVWREITSRRMSETDTETDVLRRAFQMPPKAAAPEPAPSGALTAWRDRQSGLELPNGTKLVMSYKGLEHYAEIVGGVWLQDGEPQSAPSSAAAAATGVAMNGWLYWSAKRPGDAGFTKLAMLRKEAKAT